MTTPPPGWWVRHRRLAVGMVAISAVLAILVWIAFSGALCAWSPLACRYLREAAPKVLVNLQWALAAIAAGFGFGFLLGWARVSRFVGLRAMSRGYTELIRGTPLLIQILAVFYLFPALNRALGLADAGADLPGTLDGFLNLGPSEFDLSGAQRVVIALILNTSAYQAEIFRAGFQSISRGQIEAATAIGMSQLQTMRHVILPQSLRVMTPPLTNEYIIMFKDATPLAFVVAVPELVRASVQFGQATQAILETYVFTAIVFLIFSLLLTGLLRFLERRYRIPGLGIAVRGRE